MHTPKQAEWKSGKKTRDTLSGPVPKREPRPPVSLREGAVLAAFLNETKRGGGRRLCNRTGARRGLGSPLHQVHLYFPIFQVLQSDRTSSPGLRSLSRPGNGHRQGLQKGKVEEPGAFLLSSVVFITERRESVR